VRARKLLVYLLLAFTVFPLVELALLIEVGRRIGSLYTVAIILVTGVLGAYLARAQGLSVVRQVKARTSRGEIPGNELIDGVLVLTGAAFLITPGVITDLAGLSLVAPPTRRWYRETLKRRLVDLLTGGPV
jgi:UPF0716 protein FxsA